MDIKVKKTSFQQKLTNFFGGLGYLNCFLSWLWASLFYVSILLDSDYLQKEKIVEPMITKPPVSTVTNPGSALLAAIVTVFIIGITIYVIYKVPKAIAKKSKNLIHDTAVRSVPLVNRFSHKKLTKSRRLKLTPKIILFLKLFLVLIPIPAVLATRLITGDFLLDSSTNLFISLILVAGCLMAFSIQYGLAWILKVKPDKIW